MGKEFKKAEKFYLEALRLKPDYADARNNLAGLKRVLEKFSRRN